MSSRKSTRIAAKAQVAAVAPTQLPQKEKLSQKKSPTEDKNENTAKRVQGSRNFKKRKISNKKDSSSDNTMDRIIKGKALDFEIMKDIPFDILLEIFRLLEPLDLLQLSRVSKALHDLLTSNDVAFLWKQAYNNIDRSHHIQPPPCPDDTNMVFYTNYLYGRHCQFCSSGLGRMLHESAFIRLCSKCADQSFIDCQSDKTDRIIRRLCNKWSFKSGDMILKVEYQLRLEEYKQAQKTKGVQSYVTERERVLRKRYATGSVLAQWRLWMNRVRLDTLKVIRSRRAEAIMKKLNEEEYKLDFELKYRFRQAPHVRKSHPLTDSEWSLIRADILDFFQDIRDNQAISDLRSRLLCRISHLAFFLSKWRIHPTAWWIASSSEPIAAFIKSGTSARHFGSSDFEKVEPQLRDIVASWKEKTDNYLISLIPQPSRKKKKQGPHDGPVNALELATTFFKCYWCTEPISHPRILNHVCLYKDVEVKEETQGDEQEDDMEDPEEDVVVNARGPREPRPPKDITPDLVLPMLIDCYSLGMREGIEGVTYDEEASKTVQEIITAYGEDPMTVTYAAMEENPARLECLRCSRTNQKAKSVRLVMKWAMALVHELEEHYGEPPSSEPAWAKVDSVADLANVKRAEIKVMRLARYRNVISCNHCSEHNIDPGNWFDHINEYHEITADEATISNHFSFPVDSSIKLTHPAVKI